MYRIRIIHPSRRPWECDSARLARETGGRRSPSRCSAADGDHPLIASEQALQTDELSAWFGGSLLGVTLAATYTLSYNGTVLARRGVGYMLGLENIAPTGVGSGLEFRPLWPPIVAHIDFAWRRDAKLSNAAALYLEEMREACRSVGGAGELT